MRSSLTLRLGELVIVTVLLSIAVSAHLYAQGTPRIQNGFGFPLRGSVTVYLRSERGEPLDRSVAPHITLTAQGGPVAAVYPQTTGDGWVFSDVAAGNTYDVEVTAEGYQPAHETVTVVGSGTATVIVFLKALDERLDFHPPTGQFVLAPRAQKEVEKGMKDLRAGRIPSSQKHFQRALAMAPGNPYVNYVLGMSYLLAKQFPDARTYLEKSVSIDAKQVPSLLALGTLRFETADYAGAAQILNQAVQQETGTPSWRAEWMLADCYVHQRGYMEARDHAEKALAIGKEKATPVQLFLGQALAGLGDRDGAIKALQTYLMAYPHDPNAARIQAFVAKLKQPPAVVETAAALPAAHGPSSVAPAASSESMALSVPAPPVELPPKENWAPADIDNEKPFVISGAACPVTKILDEAGKHAVQLASDLQKFTATEEYESVEVKRDERLETPVSRTFNYLVYIETPRPHLIEVKEIRNNNLGVGDMPGRVADNGAPGLVLVFHPSYREDFSWRCEGLGEWRDQPAWLVRFEQRTDRPTSLLAAFDTPSQQFNLPLKGRAWISAKAGQVVRLEADLVRPVEPLDLKRQHWVIEYAPVSFKAHKVTLWLPESADVYIQVQGHYLHHLHRFSNFKLFWVGTSQKIEPPKEAAQPKQ